MISALLLRGMLAGIFAGLLSFGFATVVTEPLIEKAIALESSAPEVDHHALEHGQVAEHQHDHGTEVDRSTQAGAGLFVGLIVLGAAVGGLFSLVFAFCKERIGSTDPRKLSVQIACAGFIALVVIPTFKYPANPPGVGSGDTIGWRTFLFFALLFLSVGAMTAALQMYKRMCKTTDSFNAGAASGLIYLAVMTVVIVALPSYDEAPHSYPAALLWHYRLASVGTQGTMWLGLGLAFGFSAYHLTTVKSNSSSYKVSQP